MLADMEWDITDVHRKQSSHTWHACVKGQMSVIWSSAPVWNTPTYKLTTMGWATMWFDKDHDLQMNSAYITVVSN